ncbi:MAG: hypothetical protein ACYS8W_12060 [Planctomycetota bacterium]|jgi:hypothetical protein
MPESGKAIQNPVTLNQAQLKSYVLACCDFSGASYSDMENRLRAALPWFETAATQDLAFISLNVFFDLGHLLNEGYLFPFAGPSRYDYWPADEKGIRSEYENRFLNRIMTSPDLTRLRSILENSGNRNAVINRIMEIILSPLKDYRREFPAERHISIVPTLLRSMVFDCEPDTSNARSETEKFLEARSGVDGFILSSQRKFVETAPKLFHGRKLFSEIDFHELENFEVYERTDARMRARAVKELEYGFGRFNPRILDLVREQEVVMTELRDAGYYPVGGFAEITNRPASLENMVRSELIYAGEDVEGLDLFNLRFAENELLYYNRDEGRLMRRRRRVNFVIDLSTDMRIAPRRGEGQVWTHVCALMLRLAGDINTLFEKDAVKFRLIAVAPESSEEIEKECNLLSVLLGREIALGRADVRREKLLDLSRLDEIEWKPYIIVITASGAAPETLHYGDFPIERKDISTLWLQIGREFPPPHGANAFHINYDSPLRRQFIDTRDILLRTIAAIK